MEVRAKIFDGKEEITCEIVGETATGYRCRVDQIIPAPGEWMAAKQIVHVPKYAVRIELKATGK